MNHNPVTRKTAVIARITYPNVSSTVHHSDLGYEIY